MKQKPDQESKPARKRARYKYVESEASLPATAPKRAKPRAKLEVIMNMPVEVFIEVGLSLDTRV